MRCTLWWMLLAVVGCGPEAPVPEGTSVGNPGKGVTRLAEAPGIEVEAAEADLAWDAVDCRGGAVPVGTPGVDDLLDPEPREWPAGAWCALTVAVAGPIAIVADAGELEPLPVVLVLEVEPILTLWAADTIEVDEHSYVLELGAPGWIDVEGLPAQESIEVTANGELAELHEALVLSLLRGTALYLDDDADGVLSPAERSAGPVASTLSPPPVSWEVPDDTGAAVDPDSARLSTEGCNCTSSPGGWASGWLATLLALVVTRRR